MAKQIPIDLLLQVKDLTGKGIQDAHRNLSRQLRQLQQEPVDIRAQQQRQFLADIENRRAAEVYGAQKRQQAEAMAAIEQSGIGVTLERKTEHGIAEGVKKGLSGPMTTRQMGEWMERVKRGFGVIVAMELGGRLAEGAASMIRAGRAGDPRAFAEGLRRIPGMTAIENLASFPAAIVGVRTQADYDADIDKQLDAADRARKRAQEHRRYLLAQDREDRASANELEGMQDRRGLLGLTGFNLRRATVDVQQREAMRQIEEKRRVQVEDVNADPFMSADWKAERILRAKTDFERRKTEIAESAAEERKRIAADEARHEYDMAKTAADSLADELDKMLEEDRQQQQEAAARKLGVAKSIMADLQQTGGYRAAPLLMSSTLQAPIQRGASARVTPGEEQITRAINERAKETKRSNDLLQRIVDKLGSSPLVAAGGL